MEENYTQKLESVLLVDDSIALNFYNKKVIEKSEKVSSTFIANDGIKALAFLKRSANSINKSLPNIIFLDINMPRMNGFEFLEACCDCGIFDANKTIVVFLTTSAWSKDHIKAQKNSLVHDIVQKPLDKDYFEKIYTYYITEYLKCG